MKPKEVIELAKKNDVQVRRPEVHRLPGHLAAHDRSRSHRLDEALFEDGIGVRRLVDPRLAADQRVRHAHDPGPDDGEARSVLRAPDALARLHGLRSDHRSSPTRATRATSRRRPRPTCKPDRHRRHVVLRPRGRVLRLRRRPLRPLEAERGLLLPRHRRGRVEHGPRGVPEPRLQDAPQGGLLPRPADRHARRSPHGDDARARGVGHRGRGRPPRGRHRRSVRDRHEVQSPAPPWPTSSCGSSTSSRTSPGSTARRATFMPKPLFGDNGSGMHVHQSLWKEGKPLFAGDGYAGLSRDRRSTTSAASSSTRSRSRRFTNPTTNSYRRLVPGFEAPVNLAYSSRNRSASVRIPITGPIAEDAPHRGPLPRPELQPVPRVRAMMMAGLDGIQNKIDPGDPLDKDIYALSPRGAEGRPAHAGQPRRGARQRSSGITSSSSAATSSRRTRSTSGSTTSGPRSSTRSACGPTPHEFFLYYDI